jgi:CAAX protease family protein
MSGDGMEAGYAVRGVPQTAAQPYGWIGLVLSIVAMVVLAILISIAVIVLVWALQIPFDVWQQTWSRVTDAHQALKQGDLARCFSLLLVGPGPKIDAIIGDIVVCLLQLALAAAIFLLARFRGGLHWRDLVAWRAWSWRQYGQLFCILLVTAVALNVVISSLTNHFYPQPSQTPEPFGVPTVLDLFGNVVLAAIFEEMIIRGWLYTGIRAKLGAWQTILITSVLFAALHSISSAQDILPTLPLGLAAGYLRERTGSVKAPMSLHLFHNAIATILSLI